MVGTREKSLFLTKFPFVSTATSRSMQSDEEITPEGTDMGVAQTLVHAEYGVSREEGIRRIESSRDYMKSKPVSKELLELCRNGNELCTVWALTGECGNNAACKSTFLWTIVDIEK
jgi:hypothetical protein